MQRMAQVLNSMYSVLFECSVSLSRTKRACGNWACSCHGSF